MRTDIQDLALEVVRFEKKKAILPLLMVSVLLISVIYGLHLRDSRQLDEQLTHNSRSAMTNMTVIMMKEQYFPVESGVDENNSLRATEKVSRNAERNAKQILSQKRRMLLAPAVIALSTDIYPLTPGNRLIDNYRLDDTESIIFRFKDGYVATRERVATLSEIFYRQRQFSGLVKRSNSTNMSYSEFQKEVRKIKSVEYSDPELRQSLFDNGLPEGMEHFPEEVEDNFRQDNWKELQLIHFAPSAIATFIIYYLLSGLAVASYRRIFPKVRSLLAVRKSD